MAAVSVLVVLLVSLLVARVGTVALTLTGMSREAARFQARSAFFGVGFTTGEAEAVVGHPVRRRIIMWLILLGNAGVVDHDRHAADLLRGRRGQAARRRSCCSRASSCSARSP